MRAATLAVSLLLGACSGPAAQAPLDAGRAEQLRDQLDAAQEQLSRVAASPPGELEDPELTPAVRGAIQAQWQLEQARIQTEILSLGLQLRALTGQRPLPANLG